MNIPFKATVDIQEPDQSTAGIVDQTCNLWNKYEHWYNETFLEQNSTQVETHVVFISRPFQVQSICGKDFSRNALYMTSNE